MDKGRIEFFDWLRALAIGFVIVTHYQHNLLPGGAIGVPIFFCLSGYLITTILLNEKRLDWSSIWRFVARRFFRVYPAYVVAVLLNLVVMVYFGSDALGRYIEAIPRLLTFTFSHSSWLGMGVGVFWTLRIEFWFYMLMPLVMVVLGRGRLFTVSMVALFVGLTIWRFVHPENSYFMVWANNLLIGALVAITAHHLSLKCVGRYYGAVSFACIAMLAMIAVFVPNTDRLVIWPLEALVACGITAIWVASYLGSSHALRIPIVAWFGRISYSVYLVHAIPLGYVHGWKLKVIALAISIAIAVILHRYIEKPFIALGRKLTKAKSIEATT